MNQSGLWSPARWTSSSCGGSLWWSRHIFLIYLVATHAPNQSTEQLLVCLKDYLVAHLPSNNLKMSSPLSLYFQVPIDFTKSRIFHQIEIHAWPVVGSMSERVYELMRQILQNCIMIWYKGTNDTINTKFGTCHDSWAAVTCLEQTALSQFFNYELIRVLCIAAPLPCFLTHYTDVTMTILLSQITDNFAVFFNRSFKRTSRKTSKLRVTCLCEGNPPWPVDSPHNGPVKRKIFPFDDVIMSPTHHVTIDSEDPVLQALQGHPFDRQAALLDLAVVTVLVQVPGQAEVSNLYHQLRTHPAHRNNLHHWEFTEEKFSKTSPSSQFPTLKHKLRHFDEILHHWRYRMS